MAAMPADEPDAEEPDDIEYVPGVAYPVVAALLALAVAATALVTWLVVRPGTPGDPSAVDTGFTVDMRTHHQQAVELSLLELANGENDVARSFAQEIIIRQEFELGLMTAELDDWGIDTATRPDEAMAWMGMSVPVEEMPGLATPEQLDELRAARGAEADALFLELMVEHHRGGVHMAEHAADNASTEDVRQLASGIERVQRVEINEMLDTAEREGLG
jgi:uncharacterized protein (DUF305 family)